MEYIIIKESLESISNNYNVGDLFISVSSPGTMKTKYLSNNEGVFLNRNTLITLEKYNLQKIIDNI